MIVRRDLLAAGLALSAGGAWAQTEAGLVHVVLTTAKGAITLELNTGKAPVTAGNFLRYVTAKRYDHASFYRVSRAPNDANYGLIQGGVKGDPAKLFKPIAHESTLVTGLTHKDGTISMGRGKPGSANAEFFICVGDHPGFDATPDGEGDHGGFAAFGRVIEGMDVVHAIFALPTSPTAGSGALRGQMLSPAVPILTARKTA